MTCQEVSEKQYYVAATIEGQYPRFSTSGLKRIQERCTLPRPLPIDHSQEIEKRKIPTCVALDLARYDFAGKVLPHLFTFKEYMEYALYDPRFGYYTTRPGIGSDFKTTPMSNSPLYGACLADLIFRQWKGMVEAGTFELQERFDIVELGAGTGVLARDFVQHAKVQAGLQPEWRVFYDNIRYMTGEISPTLQSAQKETTSAFRDKVSVIPADARHLAAAFGVNGIQGVIISNELPDAFSCHKILKDKNGHLFVAVTVPVIKELAHFLYGYPGFLEQSKAKALKKLAPRIISMNALLKRTLSNISQFIPSETTPQPLGKENGYLSKELYQELRALELEFFDIRISWKEFWVPVARFPEVNGMRDAHRDFFQTLKPMDPTPFNSDLRPFMEGCGRILQKGGIYTTDYMYDNVFLGRWRNSFRTYPRKTPHDYSASPGEEDITTDVNASALAVEGIRAKFTPFLFCSERELLSQLPEQYPYLNIPKNGLPFFVLTMLKKGTKTTYRPEILTRPVTYREMFLKISDWSNTAIPSMRLVNEKTALAAREMYTALLVSEKQKPSISEIKEVSLRTLDKVETKNALLETAIETLLKRMIYSHPNFLTIANCSTSVENFNYKRIVPYFTGKDTADNVDRLMIQIVHQILHLHYVVVPE